MPRINLANYLVTNKNTDSTKIFDKTQLEKHNQEDNCYVGMGNGKVYDISKYKIYLKNENKNKDIKFNLTCGSFVDINPLSIFKTDKYIDYEVGDIKDFVYYKNIKLASFIIINIISLLIVSTRKTSFNFIFYIILLISAYIIIRYMFLMATYKNPVKFRTSYEM